MTIRTRLPRHSCGKFNLECNGPSGLLPLPGLEMGIGKGDRSALLKCHIVWTRKARNYNELSVLHTGKACLRTANKKASIPKYCIEQ